VVRTKEKKTLTVDWTPKGLEHNFTEESSMKRWMMTMLVAVTSGVGGSAIASQDQRPLTVIVQVKVLPGMESAFETAVLQILVPTRAEEGCVSFTVNQSVQDPTEFSAVEVWRSRADADKHGETPHMKKCLDTVGKMFAPGYPILKSYENLDETFEE
jgi:quinol monooxygenase YgiN